MANLKTYLIIVSAVFCAPLSALCENYEICDGVNSKHFADPNEQRSMVINFNPSTSKFIFVRCGKADGLELVKSTQECQIYGQYTESSLCRKEKKMNKRIKTAKGIISFFGKALSSGVTELGQVALVRSTARSLSSDYECEGTQLLKHLANGEPGQQQLIYNYFNTLASISPMGMAVVIANKKPDSKKWYVFNYLDAVVSETTRQPASTSRDASDHKILRLTGPSFFEASRNSQGQAALMVDEDLKAQFCNKF